MLQLGLLVIAAAGCGPAGDRPQVSLDRTLAGFPHAFDVYAPNGEVEAAVILLHGGGGFKQVFADQLGIVDQRRVVDGDWLDEHDVVAVFPQGQAEVGMARTWDNYVMESGQDDVAFLVELAETLRDEYEVDQVFVAGHSNGGMMVNRLWCEAADAFDGFGAFAGPAALTLGPEGEVGCSPSVARPYFGIVGEADAVLQTRGAMNEPVWSIEEDIDSDAIVDPRLVNEVLFHRTVRAPASCDETPGVEPTSTDGPIRQWSACDGELVVLTVAEGEHAIADLQRVANLDLKTRFLEFVR